MRSVSSDPTQDLDAWHLRVLESARIHALWVTAHDEDNPFFVRSHRELGTSNAHTDVCKQLLDAECIEQYNWGDGLDHIRLLDKGEVYLDQLRRSWSPGEWSPRSFTVHADLSDIDELMRNRHFLYTEMHEWQGDEADHEGAVRHFFTHGQCHAFALALQEQLEGRLMACGWEEDRFAGHVYFQAADGRYLDVTGEFVPDDDGRLISWQEIDCWVASGIYPDIEIDIARKHAHNMLKGLH